jgi:predicted ABC-class ATPase
MESIEMGAKVLLFDEDTCATNFMIRDTKMAALVSSGEEPITPFISRVRSLYETGGVSSILVVGGAGDYLNVADRVVKMKAYEAHDVSEMARQVVEQFKHNVPLIKDDPIDWQQARKKRVVAPNVLQPGWKCSVRDRLKISYGPEIEIRLEAVEQLASEEQTNCVLRCLHAISDRVASGGGEPNSVKEVIDAVVADMNQNGVRSPDGFDGKLALPRRFEVAAALNRLRLDGLIK